MLEYNVGSYCHLNDKHACGSNYSWNTSFGSNVGLRFLFILERGFIGEQWTSTADGLHTLWEWVQKNSGLCIYNIQEEGMSGIDLLPFIPGLVFLQLLVFVNQGAPELKGADHAEQFLVENRYLLHDLIEARLTPIELLVRSRPAGHPDVAVVRYALRKKRICRGGFLQPC
jgi:hypothetical protein